MKRTLIMLATGVAFSLSTAQSADAQQMTWTDNAFVTVNFGGQAPSRTLNTTTSPDIYGEPASFATTQDVGGGAFFDIAGGYKIWQNLAVGIGVTHVGSKADLTVNASIPDPLFFDQPRLVTTSVADAKHSQTGDQSDGHLGHADHRQDRHRLPVRTDDLPRQSGRSWRAHDQPSRARRSPRSRSPASTRRRSASTSAST